MELSSFTVVLTVAELCLEVVVVHIVKPALYYQLDRGIAVY